jgi:hypothetical protein
MGKPGFVCLTLKMKGRMDFYLCHKCCGNLSRSHESLYGCRCISGYVRDFYAPVTLEIAVAAQASHEWPREAYATWCRPQLKEEVVA